MLVRDPQDKLKLVSVPVEPYKVADEEALDVKIFPGNVSQPKDKSGKFSYDKIRKAQLIWHEEYGAALVIQYLNCLATASIGEDSFVV